MIFRKVSPGQPVVYPAETHNAFIDAAVFAREQRHKNKHAPRETAQTGIVLVKNGSGVAVPRHGVMGIEGTVILPADNEDEFLSRVALDCTTPDADDHRGIFVVTLEPLAINAIGRAVIAGATPVQIDVTDAAHQFADVKDADNTQLKSSGGDGSARILYKDAGTGTVWAYVQLNALAIGRTTSVTVLGSLTEGDEAADTESWSRAVDHTPVSIYDQTRHSFYHAGDEKWYAYARLWAFDAVGALISISAETRIEIDAPEDC